MTKDDLMKIVGLMIDDVNNMLADRKLHIEVPDAVKERLVDLGFDPKMGARPLRRVIQEHIEDQIADYVLDHPDATNLVAQVDEAGKITVAATQKAIAAPMDAATDAKTEE